MDFQSSIFIDSPNFAFPSTTDLNLGSINFDQMKIESDFEMQTSLAFWNQTLRTNPIQEEDLHCSILPPTFESSMDFDKPTTNQDSSEEAATITNSSPGFSEIKSLLDQDFSKESETEEESATSKSGNALMKRGSRKRKDVVLKTALRKCRKYLQQRLVSLTGFVCSKKVKENDPLLPALDKLLEEMPQAPEKLKILFFMAALLYPTDAKRNVDKFISSPKEKASTLKLIQNVHDVLYKYSHEKLKYFCSVPELAFLFEHYYHHGDAQEDTDPGFQQALKVIHADCKKTLKDAKC